MTRPTKSLVEQVNLIFHEIEASHYGAAHPEIFVGERGRWLRLLAWATQHTREPRRIVDLASGTGFVASMALASRVAFSEFVSTDLTPDMLRIAEQRLANLPQSNRLSFRVAPADATEEPDASVDIVTANSALHHFPDLAATREEIARILKPGGVLLIAHEPNRRFWEKGGPSNQAELWENRLYRASVYGNPSRYIRKMLRALHLIPPRAPEPTLADLAATECSQRSLQIDGAAITSKDVERLVDYHVPRNSEGDETAGFDAMTFGADWFPGWKVGNLETYGCLGDLPWRRGCGWLHAVERRLAKRHPDQGCHFALTLTKPE